jgi:uncharacterized protein YqjF (DUF2071 family)
VETTIIRRSATPDTRRSASASDGARRRMLRPGERPLFVADWTDVLFVHFAVDPRVLQPRVPFPLDLYRGRAYLSLVAFTQRGLRPRVGGRLAARLAAPLATHEFLNARTYVRCGGERGIYFLAEWIPNRLATLIGPRMYGLPYRLARMRYGARACRGEVVAPAGRFAWSAKVADEQAAPPARPGLERFLLERYTAYTRRGDTALRFRVWHEPWLRVRARVGLSDTTLLAAAFPWLGVAEPILAHYSPGVHDVWIGPPRRVKAKRFPATTPVLTWLPPASLVAAGLALRGTVPAWAFMWALCFALFFSCKWVTWRRAPAELRRNVARTLAYFFAWVGMAAAAFLDPTRHPDRVTPRECAAAVAKTVTGAALLWGLTRLLVPHHALAAGWIGMTGLILVLHFGTFHLLSIAWRAAGFDGAPIMNAPARSDSLAEFWGRRWNLGFHRLAHDLVFRPLRLCFGAAGALLAAFAVSGLVHDLVISVPARGGYGLPTLYFLIQGAALLFERSAAGARVRGRLFTAAVVLVPLPWLFHPTFVRNVVLPLLGAIGAT